MPKFYSRAQFSGHAQYAMTQLGVQLIGFVSGLLLVRYMDKYEYGLYTLSMYILGAANVLTDLGIASGMLAIGGRLNRHRAQFGRLLSEGLAIQRVLSLGTLAILTPLAAALFLRQGASATYAIFLALISVLPSLFTTQSLMRLNLLRLLGGLRFQQRLDFSVSVGRLVSVGVAVATLLNALTAALVNFVAFLATFAILRTYASRQHIVPESNTSRHNSELWSIVRRQAPNSFYYIVSGQIATLLVGILGNADRVADVGALGRLSVIFALIASVMTAITLPYFSQAPTRKRLATVFILVSLCFALLLAVLLIASGIAPDKILWILGSKYSDLKAELPWMLSAATVAAWAGALYGLGCARAWIVPASLSIPAGLLAVVLTVRLADLSTVRGAFILNTTTAIVALAINTGFICFKLIKYDAQSSPKA